MHFEFRATSSARARRLSDNFHREDDVEAGVILSSSRRRKGHVRYIPLPTALKLVGLYTNDALALLRRVGVSSCDWLLPTCLMENVKGTLRHPTLKDSSCRSKMTVQRSRRCIYSSESSVSEP